MKKSVFYSIILTVSMLMPACNFLDLHDKDAFEEDIFYRTSEDMEGLLASAYAGIRPAYDKLFFVTEMKSDNATTTDMGTAGGKYYTFVSHTVTSSNDIVGDIYSSFYICIHRCNLLLEHIDIVNIPEADKKRLRGEALFLRALSHFYLTRLWGPVTIMRHTVSGSKDALSMSRSSREDVYACIINDLQTVADGNLLPANCTGDQFGHASGTAACALLGRVYLQYAATLNHPEAYTTAISYLEKAITISGYTGLTLNYMEIFDLANQTNAEIIFPIMYMPNEAEHSNFATYFQPQSLKDETSTLTGRGFNVGQDNLNKDFEKNDKARLSLYRSFSGVYYTKKYVDLVHPSGYSGNLWYEIRFADVYLMLAEAYERKYSMTNDPADYTQAVTYLDKVRLRIKSTLKSYEIAKTNPTYAAAYPTLRDAIFHERRAELCFENHRWFDLMRLYPNPDDFVNYMRSVNEPGAGAKYTGFQAYELLLPIPYDEVYLNPDLGQNDGY